MSAPAIEASGLTRVLPGPVPVTLVREVSLRAERGEFVAVTGPSGSGKSSLLYLLGLLDRPTAGGVRIEGRETGGLDEAELARLRLEKLGFVFQFHFLLAEFSVLGNVMIPMRRLARLAERDMRARAGAILADLGLSAHLDKTPDRLSGGERQRVAIARALANDPLIVLADEPTGNLDSRSAQAVFDVFERIARKERRTVITVTHDPGLAARTDRRIRLLDGRVVTEE